MTNNFKILNDFELPRNHDLILERIEKIESLAKNNELDYIYLEGRNILELILEAQYDDVSHLDLILNDLNANHPLPSKVKNALYAIKQKGNEGAHATTKPSDKPFHIKRDLFSVVEFIKQIFIVIKYFIRESNTDMWTPDDSNEYTFNSEVYLPNYDKYATQEYSIVEKEDIRPNTEALESKLKGIFELINSDYSFLIPTYQRVYSWDSENIGIFLQDILDRSKDKQTHYLGSLAIAFDGKNKLLRLIDGQQRITTSLLLIKAMINKFETSRGLTMPKELENLKEKLDSKYINSAGQHGEMNYVKKILKGYDVSDKSFKASNAKKNYDQICEFLDTLSYLEFDEFYTTFVYYFVIAELRFKNDLGHEIQIFENLNSKGMELSQWDLIKNYIYKNVNIDFLITHEHEIEKLLNDLFVIPASIAFGTKASYKKLSEFFITYSRIENKLLNGEVLSDKGKIHKVFANIWPLENEGDFKAINELKASLLKAGRYFSIYSCIESKDYLDPSNPLFEFKLHLENTSAKDAHYPLIINAIYTSSEWDDYRLEKIKASSLNDLLLFISDIDKYITRLLVVNNTGQSLPTFFDKVLTPSVKDSHDIFIQRISESGKGTSLPSWKDFAKELKEKNDWQKEYALAVLRTFNHNVNAFKSKKYEIIQKPSLEHIFPQKPSDTSQWFINEGITWNRFKDKLTSKINKLGNYLILSQSLNSKASNYDYTRKLSEYEPDIDSLQISGIPGSLMDLTLKNSFTFYDIDERTKELANLIAPLYKLSHEK